MFLPYKNNEYPNTMWNYSFKGVGKCYNCYEYDNKLTLIALSLQSLDPNSFITCNSYTNRQIPPKWIF